MERTPDAVWTIQGEDRLEVTPSRPHYDGAYLKYLLATSEREHAEDMLDAIDDLLSNWEDAETLVPAYYLERLRETAKLAKGGPS